MEATKEESKGKHDKKSNSSKANHVNNVKILNCPLCEHTCQEPSELEQHVNRAHFDPIENPSSSRIENSEGTSRTSPKKKEVIKTSPDKVATDTSRKKHIVLRKLELAEPFNMFFTKVQDVASTHKGGKI